MRGAAANLWASGVDGLCTHFLRWPHGDEERSWLCQIADPELLVSQSKRYRLAQYHGPDDGDDGGMAAAFPRSACNVLSTTLS